MNTDAGVLIWHGQEIPAVPPGVEFNEERHEYTVMGERWPNVTGFLPERYDNGDKTAALWGQAAHDHAFHLVKGSLVRYLVTDERMELTLQGIEKGLKHFEIPDGAPVLAEHIVYSRRFRVIGRFDFLFDLGAYDLLIDLKTGARSEHETRKTGMQEGGYVICIIDRGLSTLGRLRVAEMNVQMDGSMIPREWRGRQVRDLMNVFLAQVTVQNYFRKI
jgi:hypothetical protein